MLPKYTLMYYFSANFVLKQYIEIMTKIGLLSDTHAYLNDAFLRFFESCDEVWHAGDWGSMAVYDALSAFKPLRGVWGNIDGMPLRSMLPQINRFTVEEVNVLLTHIGGYPGKYDKSIVNTLQSNPPQLFVCGHSHILKVMYDKKLNILHVNPVLPENTGSIKCVLLFAST
jgi:uncharacterized protein